MDEVMHTCINPTMKVTAMAICSFTDSVLSLQNSENCWTVSLVRLLTGVTELVTLTHVVMMCTFGDFKPFSMAEPIIRQATAKVPTVTKKYFIYMYWYIHVESYYFHFINGFLSFQSVSLRRLKTAYKKSYLLWKHHIFIYYENIIISIIFTVTI